MTEEFAGGQDLCLGGEELVEQAVVQFLIEVGATVLDDDEAELASATSLITPAGGFRQRTVGCLACGVLLGRQRLERRLLRIALSGYASVYNVNTCLPRGWEKCSCLVRGARG
jgi:hypothetical protein